MIATNDDNNDTWVIASVYLPCTGRGIATSVEAANDIEVMTMEAPPHTYFIMAGDYYVSFDESMSDGMAIGPSIVERAAHYAGRPMVLKNLWQRHGMKAMNTFAPLAEATLWPRTPREQPTQIEYVATLEDHGHEVFVERKRMDFVNMDHSFLRMKMTPRHINTEESAWEEPEEIITKASDAD